MERIVRPTIAGLHSENLAYFGFVFFGLINVNGDPYVIEYNVRMGDPETEAIFPRLKTPMLDLLEAMANGNLGDIDVSLDSRTAATIFLVSGGYPGDIEKGKTIVFPENLGENQWLFQAGTKQDREKIVTNGGRVIAVTSLGEDIPSALSRSNTLAKQIEFDGKFNRTDIGLDLLNFKTP